MDLPEKLSSESLVDTLKVALADASSETETSAVTDLLINLEDTNSEEFYSQPAIASRETWIHLSELQWGNMCNAMNGAAITPPSTSKNTSPTTEHSGQESPEQLNPLTIEERIAMNNTQGPAHVPDITLYFLQSSRSIRIAWILEELNLDYKVIYYDREPSMAAPANFKTESGGSMGKAPVLVDGDLVVQESGAITQYLIAAYDNLHYLLPPKAAQFAKTLEYMHAAEGTFFVHGLVPFYARRATPNLPDAVFEALTADIGADLDWLEDQIKNSNTRYLVADHVTAADTMMGFSVQFILEFGLHPQEVGGEARWDNVKKWLENIEASTAYQRAVAKTGHTLRPQ